jgi:hypothetical protein
MFKKLALSSALAALSLSAASAATYSDTVFFGLDGVLLSGLNSSTTETFDITDSGFKPLKEEIVSLSGEITFLDVFGGESFSVVFGPGLATYNFGSLPFGFTTLSGAVDSADVLADLSADGRLDLTVERTSGSFAVLSASITAESQAVPEGGSSMLMLGLGLCGVAAAGRRLKARGN